MMDLYVRPCAGVIIHSGGKILMHKRSPNAHYMPGRWSTPGGHIEEDELTTPRAAGVRELCEETGLREGQFTAVRLKYAKVEVEGGRFVPAFDYEAWTETEHALTGDGEGKPQWIGEDEILALELMDKSRIMMEHTLHGAQEGTAYFLYDGEDGPEFFPMDLSDGMRLFMTAGALGEAALPLLPQEMHDPSLAARRALGGAWTDGHDLVEVTVDVTRESMAIRLSYAEAPGTPHIFLTVAGKTSCHPWNGYKA